MKTIPRLLVPFLVLSIAGGSSAATVAWTAVPVSHTNLNTAADVSVVSTLGILVGAVNVGGSATMLNGVSFAAGTGTISNASYNWSVPTAGSMGNDASTFYSTDGSTVLNEDNAWLHSGKWYDAVNTDGRLNMLNLTIGQTYQVQLFVADIRSAQDGRAISLDGGTTKHQYGFSPVGGPYGYLTLTGTFVADSASQSVNMRTFNANDSSVGTQLNAFQVRAIPEPATAGIVVLGFMGMLRRRRN